MLLFREAEGERERETKKERGEICERESERVRKRVASLDSEQRELRVPSIEGRCI